MSSIKKESSFGFLAALEALRHVDSATQQNIIKNISLKDPALAHRLKKNIFSFNDLIQLNPKGVEVLLNKIPHKHLVMSLRTASHELKAFLLENIPKRRGDSLIEDLVNLGPQPISKIEDAQRTVIAKVLELEAAGLITIHRNPDDDPLV